MKLDVYRDTTITVNTNINFSEKKRKMVAILAAHTK